MTCTRLNYDRWFTNILLLYLKQYHDCWCNHKSCFKKRGQIWEIVEDCLGRNWWNLVKQNCKICGHFLQCHNYFDLFTCVWHVCLSHKKWSIIDKLVVFSWAFFTCRRHYPFFNRTNCWQKFVFICDIVKSMTKFC